VASDAYGSAISPLVVGGRVFVPLWDMMGSSGVLALGTEG
jgi:hypothetical protein